MNYQRESLNDIRIPEVEFSDSESGVDFHWWHNDKTPLHTHTYYEIVIMTQGNVPQICNGVQYNLEKYDVFILKPGDEHIFLVGKNSAHLNLSVVPEVLSTLCDAIAPSLFAKINEKAPVKMKCTKVELDYFMFLTNLIALSSDGKFNEANVSLIKCIITNIMLAFNRFIGIRTTTETEIPGWLVLFLDKLNSPDVFNCPLKDIYKLAPYSQTMLNIYFKQYVGVTPIAYIKKLKMNYAIQLLTHSNYSIEQIGIRLNYTASHFTHEFTKETGMSPIKYRKRFSGK